MSRGYLAITAMLKARSGLILGPDKTYLVETRLAGLMKRENLPNLDALADKLKPNSALEHEVVESMTTNESLFFRDGKPFDALHSRILPRLHAARPPGTKLRIWSAAASTGQEAYSIAMIVAELGATLAGRKVDIVGTDIARGPLARATAGLFSPFEVQRGLSPSMLDKYFFKEGAQWRATPGLRAAVSFREWNLLADHGALGIFDVIFCRNVLIYFDAPIKKRVVESLARQLEPDGVLFLGGCESIVGVTQALQPITGEGSAYAPALGGRPRAAL